MISQPSEIERLEDVDLFAFLGEDELGSGEIGLKQATVPAGTIPMVSIHLHKMQKYQHLLQVQADICGKTIYLCRYELKEIVAVCKPGGKS